ncbi:hypothetical protein [Priestia megaterium]|uniref:hypothetical protein n=1 Tax=Priestia megaterium TaxID=1404 RepID=UPI00101E1F7D|nr:hypothetical protein [Priestia megaterium]
MSENYSNINNKNKINENPEENLDIYLSSIEQQNSVSTKEKTISNIRYMQKKLSDMVTEGSISKEDWEYEILSTYISTASEYLKNTEPTYNDSYKHYIAFRDFRDHISLLQEGGGDNVQ